MPRKHKPKLWSWSTGERGEKVGIREPRRGGRLRWDLRSMGQGRPEVYPPITVRADAKAQVDPVLEARAIALCKKKHAELTLRPGEKESETFTIGKAYALFFNPRRKALPESRSARVHHAGSRAFWTKELGADTAWNDVKPADVTAAVLRLKDAGQVATAEKRLSNLHALYVWLTEEMEMDLKDITRGRTKLKKRVRAGYRPTKPRLLPEQMRALRKALPSLSWRTRLFFTLMLGSGTRGIQARSAMRSGLNAKLEPPPPKGVAPHGWFLFAGVKGQPPHLTYLTAMQRAEIDAALAGPLAEWEELYQVTGGEADYPLIPSGRIDRGEMIAVPISDRALRYELDDIFASAGIPKAKRLGFHAVRRGWADIVREKLGLSKMAAAGGWVREETAEDYLSEYQHADIEDARRVMESEEEK